MNDTEQGFKGFGLKPKSDDARVFSFAGVFGVSDLEDLPASYQVPGQKFIKDQVALDDCTGNATAGVSEDQEGVELSEEFQFYLTKVLIEKDPASWGANLHDAALSAVKYGSVEKAEAYKHLIDRLDRDQILNPATWPSELLDLAAEHRKGSMFEIDGSHDTFDNIRSALWRSRTENQSALTGLEWRRSWTSKEGGIVDSYDPAERGFGHAIKLFGWEPELMLAQLSNGKGIGASGIFRLSRDLINRECTYGTYAFRDMPKAQAEYLHKKKSLHGLAVLRLLLSYWINSIKS